MSPVTMLVVAKAPVPGEVKTRLAQGLGGDHDRAAMLAAASLLDTVESCRRTGRRCRIALSGDLDRAVAGGELRRALVGWEVVPQTGTTLGERLAAALAGVPGPVVQVGMDTPQLTPALLDEVGDGLAGHDAVLAPAEDGGWWALGLRSGLAAAALRSVPMSTATTYADTRAALATSGLSISAGPRLRDVDHLEDVATVAALAPTSRFAAAARVLDRSTR